jgi:hypothetical protein
MIKGIVRIYHFPPSEFLDMYTDDIDEQGIVFWYKDAVEYQKEINKASQTK